MEENVQTEFVLDETFAMLDIQTVPVSIAVNISTASASPKHILPNNKTKSKKVKLRESVKSSDTSEKLLETLIETLYRGDADARCLNALVPRCLDASRQKIGKIEITNTLNRLAMSQFCGSASSESSANIQQQHLNNTNGSAATQQSASWMKSYTDFLSY